MKSLAEYEKLIADGGITNWRKARDIADDHARKWNQLSRDAEMSLYFTIAIGILYVISTMFLPIKGREERVLIFLIILASGLVYICYFEPFAVGREGEHRLAEWFDNFQQTHPEAYQKMLEYYEGDEEAMRRNPKPQYNTNGDEPFVCLGDWDDGTCFKLFKTEEEYDYHHLVHHFPYSPTDEQKAEMQTILDKYRSGPGTGSGYQR